METKEQIRSRFTKLTRDDAENQLEKLTRKPTGTTLNLITFNDPSAYGNDCYERVVALDHETFAFCHDRADGGDDWQLGSIGDVLDDWETHLDELVAEELETLEDAERSECETATT